MNHKQFLTRGIILVLVMLLTACAAPKATPCPTTVPQSCPTAVAQVSTDNNYVYKALRSYTNNTITFSPGNKCSLEGAKSINASGFTYEIVVTSQEHQAYLLAIYTIKPGNTFADIQAIPNTNTDLPTFVDPLAFDHVLPGSAAVHTIMIDKGPLYFTRIAHGLTSDLRLADLGPLEVVP
jgi:hypothetical protein